MEFDLSDKKIMETRVKENWTDVKKKNKTSVESEDSRVDRFEEEKNGERRSSVIYKIEEEKENGANIYTRSP